MDDRYHILAAYNASILDCIPAHTTLRDVLAQQIKNLWRANCAILEIGCGEGDSALPILRQTPAHMRMLDISASMIDVCAKRLVQYTGRVQFICSDAVSYLETSPQYDIIHASWMIHNLPQLEKGRLFQSIYNRLNPGGAMLLMDKVNPPYGGEELLQEQLRRFDVLPESVRREIVAHEQADFTDAFRMDEQPLLTQLQDIGFRSTCIIERAGRDVVLQARRPAFPVNAAA